MFLCHTVTVEWILCSNFFSFIPQSDNEVDDEDNVQLKELKASDDTFNNNNFHSVFIKDVIKKTPGAEPWDIQAESEVKRMTSETFTNSTSPKTIVTKTSRSSFDRQDSYDDAIEGYKSRVSKSVILDLPKVDIMKRRELFEKEQKDNASGTNTSFSATKLGSEIVSIKDRISSLRSNLSTPTVTATLPKKLEMPTAIKLEDRLSSLQQIASPVDEPSRNFLDVQLKKVREAQNGSELPPENRNANIFSALCSDDIESLEARESSGIRTNKVSCAISQADGDQMDQRLDVYQQKIIAGEDRITSGNEKAVSGYNHGASFIKVQDGDAETDDESSVSCS